MRYLGGKYRIAKKIGAFLNAHRNARDYVEPFVGGANVLCEIVGGNRYAYDISIDLIMLYQELINGWAPPTHVSESEYNHIRAQPSSALRGFIGYGCSYSGKFFGGFARDSAGRNYAANASNSLLRKLPLISDVVIEYADYRDLSPNNCLVYCDPPYAGTTNYAMGVFNSNEFFEIMRKWSKNNTVVISEYCAPDDFISVLEIPTRTDMRTKTGNKEIRIEKLYMMQ